MTMRLLSLPSARLTDELPADIRYEIDRRIAAAALTKMLKGWQVPNFQRWQRLGIFQVADRLRYQEFIRRILERLDMPAHELEPKKKLPLWAEAPARLLPVARKVRYADRRKRESLVD